MSVKEKLVSIIGMNKGIKKVEQKNQQYLEDAQKNYKETIKNGAKILGVTAITFLAIVAARGHSIKVHDVNEVQDNNPVVERSNDDIETSEQAVEKVEKEYNIKVDTSKGQDLKDEKKNTITKENVDKGEVKVEKETPTEVKYVDNSKEEETTQKAVEKAKEEKVNVVQGEVKDKNGNSTGEKITATEGKTSNTIQNNTVKTPEKNNVSTQAQENKTEKKKIDVSGAKESKSVNNNTKSAKESTMSDEQLRKIAGETESTAKTQPSNSEYSR